MPGSTGWPRPEPEPVKCRYQRWKEREADASLSLSAHFANSSLCTEWPAFHTRVPSPWPSPLGEETGSWMLAICSKYLPPRESATITTRPVSQTPSLAKWHLLLPSPLAGEGLGMRGNTNLQATLRAIDSASAGASPKRSTRWQIWRSSACWWLNITIPSPRCSHSTINSRQSWR